MRIARWDQVMGPVLAVLGVAFLVAYSVLVLVEVPSLVNLVCAVVLAVSWLAFALDYLVRWALTPRGERAAYVRGHVIELLSVFLPPVRAVRVVQLLIAPLVHRSTEGTRARSRLIVAAAVYTVVFLYFIALATFVAERDAPGATITDFGDALWWAIVTLATVGYGDVYPVTFVGRALAVVLMVGGVAILGTASATVVSYLTERIAADRSAGESKPGAEGGTRTHTPFGTGT